MVKNGTPASPATALANKVLPVPGGPANKTPFGMVAPILVNLPGSFKNSTTSSNSCFASSAPATSLKANLYVTFTHQFSTAFTKVHHSATATLCLLHDKEEQHH